MRKKDRMQAKTKIPTGITRRSEVADRFHTLEEVTAEVVSILAQGYMRYRQGRKLPSNSKVSENSVAQVQESDAFTEKRLDLSGHRSLHALTG